MKKFLKKYFIPHKGNSHKPHIFRKTGVVALTSLILFVFLASYAGNVLISRTGLVALVLPRVLVDYANEDRKTGNFNHLSINTVLEKAAQMKADDMAAKGYFAHKSPEGNTPWYWFEKAGYDFSYAGENLAVNFNDSIDVNKAWMNSPGHRENIMNGNFTEIGIATAEGMYQGKRTTFVVQLFGRPALQITAPQKKEEKQVIVVNNIKKPTQTPVKKVISTTTPVLVTTASSSVLGQSGENDLYIAVQKMSATTSAATSESYSNYFESLLLSPKKSLSLVYLFISVLIILSLALIITVETKMRHHRHLITVAILIILMFLLFQISDHIFPSVVII